ncbi:MAG: DEAD/DEAH box helicase [Spirochaetia bacterium]|jgi:superfamily II DNA or RNA helicase|nr:DEAD/DEAH box helicase [Spirochaetia bacterium]
MNENLFTPGNLVCARGRNWVVQSGSNIQELRLRPLTGSEDEEIFLSPALETEKIQQAFFPDPSPDQIGSLRSGILFREATMIKLINGAGPFRCFGHIAIEPRAYQLVPLLMALKMDTIRLLIADDVGIGKTIEAGLIVRELWDRFEITQLAVLCPPHLVSQWVKELNEHFHLPAIGLTASSVFALERNLPVGASLSDKYPVLVVSLDYIKNNRHLNNFLSSAPDCIIVDEAHTCTLKSNERNLRYELLQQLSRKKTRHMIFLTATPHSGDDEAFYNLLGLLDEKYNLLADGKKHIELRSDLALHFVQRRRQDILEYQENMSFPQKVQKEVAYKLTTQWEAFFESVRRYCAKLGKQYEEMGKQNTMIWYATLALFRCAASSPDAAIQALTTRKQHEEEVPLADEDVLDMDEVADDGNVSGFYSNNDSAIRALLHDAKALKREEDSKLNCLIQNLKHDILDEGYHPVIFCRYISTAKYVGNALKDYLPKKYEISVITGELTPAERQERIETLKDVSYPILVSTDCLSEGINLQENFNAVIHYDLAWNPTRHEQREGRIDRFGQSSSQVRCLMLYGEDNPIDGFILRVIVKKAKTIKDTLGVLVPIPENNAAISHALLRAMFLKKSMQTDKQLEFDFGEIDEAAKILETPWEDAMEKAKKNRTIFAQHSLHPENVLPEWDRQKKVLGIAIEDIEDFVSFILKRLGCGLTKEGNNRWLFNPTDMPQSLRKMFKSIGIEKPMSISFKFPAPFGSTFIHRSHPLVQLLATYFMESILSENSQQALFTGRCSVAETSAVKEVHTLYLVRLRHQVTTQLNTTIRCVMAEEIVLLACKGYTSPQWLEEDSALPLLNHNSEVNLNERLKKTQIEHALAFYHKEKNAITEICMRHSGDLLEDNRRVRSAAAGKGQMSVKPCIPPDLLGVYVLLPSNKEL